MPTIMSRGEVAAFAHCPKPLCDGYEQQPVTAVREEIGRTYAESGGDAPFVETSTVTLAFAEPGEVACPECGQTREISTQVRQEYQNLSGYDPNGLLEIKYAKKIARLEAENAELEDKIAAKPKAKAA